MNIIEQGEKNNDFKQALFVLSQLQEKKYFLM